VTRRGIRWLVAIGLIVIAAFAPSVHAAEPTTLRVFAAASLDAPLRELARAFEQSEPGVRVRFNLAGSQQLAAQLQQGAQADVFATADERWMAFADSLGLLVGAPRVFAHNSLTVIVPRTNPGRIARLQDLARPGLKLVLAASAVPVGQYAREMLVDLGAEPGFPPDYARRVLANLVSEEENVRAVVNKVQLGEADAGVVYVSDVTPVLRRYVKELPIPASANAVATYPVAIVRGTRATALANRFVALLLSTKGQTILSRHRMLPATSEQP